MLILTIRTDKPQAELGLFDGLDKLDYRLWQAHRELSSTIHLKIEEILTTNHKEFNDLEGLVVFKGPGSFTGLRIGISVVNALAYSLNVPVVSSLSDNWITIGIERLIKQENEVIALPEYGQEPRITQQLH